MASLHYIRQIRSTRLTQCFVLRRSFSLTRHNFEANLTSCEELSSYLKGPSCYQKYRIIDATWDLDVGYKEKHALNRIPGSKFFDLSECSDQSSIYPMMLPTREQFEDYISELGICNNHHVVVYDNQQDFVLFSAPRLWWMFRVFGHRNVSILNGGLTRWIQQGYHVSSGDYSEQEIFPSKWCFFRLQISKFYYCCQPYQCILSHPWATPEPPLSHPLIIKWELQTK